MKFFVAAALLVVVGAEDFFRLRSPYSYNCQNDLCVKAFDSDTPTYTSLETCQLTCGRYGALYPQPTGEVRLSPETVSFSPLNMRFTKRATSDRRVARMLDNAIQHFTRNIHFLHPEFPENQKTPLNEREFEQLKRFEEQQFESSEQQEYRPTSEKSPNSRRVSDYQRFNEQRSQFNQQKTYIDYSPFFRARSNPGAERQRFNVEVTITASDSRLTLDTNESYNLVVQTVGDETTATILATTYYGARHALETLSQLIAYDDVNGAVQIVREAQIQDEPSFKYRGFMLDTGRNFYPKEDLMRLIDGMAYNKLNYFHWDFNDATSFPLYSTRIPKMTYYGAYDARKVYYPEDIREIVEYANFRGIAVIPELGGPAHNAAGWQWAQEEGKDDLALCTNSKQPWFELSKESPAGQLNPVNPEVYEVLGDLYRDVLDYFAPDLLHMGGEDVSFKCYQQAPAIQQYFANQGNREPSSRDYFELWNTYQNNAYSELQKAAQGRKITPIISSSSFALNYLDKDSYILQVLENVDDNALEQYVQKGFRVILSNQDQWNLDSTRPPRQRDDLSASRPSPTWEDFYRNSPLDVLKLRAFGQQSSQFSVVERLNSQQPNSRNLVLGGEATLHSFETDRNGLQTKTFPRVSAFAERLWTDPADLRNLENGTVKRRLNVHRQRLVERGIQADAIQPEYCTQNEGECYSREQYVARSEITQ